MAVTLVRPSVSDDSGGGTDGTILDAAFFTDFQNKIDTALALLLPLAGGAVSGVLTLSSALDVNAPGSTFASGAAQFPTTLTLEPSTHATSRRTLLTMGDWSFYQDTAGSGTKDWAIWNPSAKGIILAPTTGAVTINAHVAGTPTFAAGDKYLVVNATGQIHVSALGPAS